MVFKHFSSDGSFDSVGIKVSHFPFLLTPFKTKGMCDFHNHVEVEDRWGLNMQWLLCLPLGTKVQMVLLLGEHGLYLRPLDSKFRSILGFSLESDLLLFHLSSLCSSLIWQVVLVVAYIPLASQVEPRTMAQVHLSMFLSYYHQDTHVMLELFFDSLPALPQNQWSVSLCLWFSNFS